jgi:hypothetical protein
VPDIAADSDATRVGQQLPRMRNNPVVTREQK